MKKPMLLGTTALFLAGLIIGCAENAPPQPATPTVTEAPPKEEPKGRRPKDPTKSLGPEGVLPY